MCRFVESKYDYTKDGLISDSDSNDHNNHYLPQFLQTQQAQHVQTLNTADETEDLIMFTVAVILFCVGAVIAVINAYCMGTRCMKVGSNRELAHFSPCTYY